MGCIFQKYAKCPVCNTVVFRECRKFRLWKAKWILKDLLPIKLTKNFGIPLLEGRCYYSSNEDTARQVAARIALKLQKPVKKLKINQLISLVLEQEPFDSKITYIEMKPVGAEAVKVQQVVESFIDKSLFKGDIVVVYNGKSALKPSSDWIMVKENGVKCKVESMDEFSGE